MELSAIREGTLNTFPLMVLTSYHTNALTFYGARKIIDSSLRPSVACFINSATLEATIDKHANRPQDLIGSDHACVHTFVKQTRRSKMNTILGRGSGSRTCRIVSSDAYCLSGKCHLGSPALESAPGPWTMKYNLLSKFRSRDLR